MAQTETTRLSRRWLIKIGIFLVGLPLLGLWGLYDATVAYPRRGEQHASYVLTQYLEQAQRERSLAPDRLAIADPAAELADLESTVDADRADAESPLSSKSGRARLRLARLEYLRSLKLMWKLNAPSHALRLGSETIHWEPKVGQAYTGAAGARTVLTPEQTLDRLRETWRTTGRPEALSGLDLFFQWLIAVAGFGGALYPLFLVVRASRRRYAWDPETRRLALPGGTSFTPDDIRDLDKRKWHKFFVTVNLNDGTAHTFDLLRHEPLEAWILDMEKARFGETDGNDGDDPDGGDGGPDRPKPADADAEQPSGSATQAQA